MTTPVAYTAFHLNLAFSSIEESQRATVIERCYWPLLRLAEKGYPIGLEATSYTLSVINEIDPKWIDACKALIVSNMIELVGSGYTQMIAPLAPAELTLKNLQFGLVDYERLLGVRPKIALLNEQAYSAGLVPLYKQSGFEAVMMDWSEPASHIENWDKSWSKRPQVLLGEDDVQMPVIWSDAMSFQKLQRYAHCEIEADEYLEFLNLQLEGGSTAFPLYTSDAEIFDYRPGRFGTEASMTEVSEYQRLEMLLRVITRSGAISLGTPSDVLAQLDSESTPIKIDTAKVPVPVKKQRKYNILRWAVSGRDDLALNTLCWRKYCTLSDHAEVLEDDWRQLCRWWASDYRTHITADRWSKLVGEVEGAAEFSKDHRPPTKSLSTEKAKVTSAGRYLIVEGADFHVSFNTRRGLAIQSMGFGSYSPAVAGGPAANGLIGTLAHGFYDTIEFGADFYTGHYVAEPADRHKITDLVQCSPTVSEDGHIVKLSCTILIGQQAIDKVIEIDTANQTMLVSYHPPFDLPRDGSARFGHVKLNPRAFARESLYFTCQNGGAKRQKYDLWNLGLTTVDHGAPVSRLVSATTGLGLTDGVLELGDDQHYVRLQCAREDVAACGMITAKGVGDSYFVRAALSIAESDETRKGQSAGVRCHGAELKFKYCISLGRH